MHPTPDVYLDVWHIVYAGARSWIQTRALLCSIPRKSRLQTQMLWVRILSLCHNLVGRSQTIWLVDLNFSSVATVHASNDAAA